MISKEEVVHSTLVGLARKLGPNAQLPTVKELCKKLSVSRSTLDRVLRTMERERLLICRHGSGIYVSPHSNQRRFGLVFGGNIHNPLNYSQFWSLLHNSAFRQADSHQNELRTYYSCPLTDEDLSDPSNFALFDDLDGRRISGILTAAIEKEEHIKWLNQWKLPIVSLGGAKGSNASVVLDSEKIITQGLGALHAAGCRRIATICSGVSQAEFDKESDPVSRTLKTASEEIGLEYLPNLRWFENTLPPYSGWANHEEAGILIIQHHFPKNLEHAPDGLFFTDDTCAHGGLFALLNMGIIPGRDIQVAVQTNKGTSLLQPFHRQIFRVEIDPDELASEMFRLVYLLLSGGQIETQQVRVSSSLISPKL